MTIKLTADFKPRDWEVGGAGDDVIGISNGLEVTVGYDHSNDEWEGQDWHSGTPLTIDEKVEVCEMMIGRWRKLKAKLIDEAVVR